MKIQPIKALLFMKEDSERVPNKNLRDFNGRPLFHWILETLSKSKYIEEIVINTDSDRIAEDSSKLFNATIHNRPDHLLELESDEPYQLLSHDLKIIEGEYFLNTHSTNPLLKIKSINKAIEIFFRNLDTFDSLFSATKFQKRFYYQDCKPINHDPRNLIKTQGLDAIFEEDSCIYLFTRKSFFGNLNRIGKQPKLFPIERVESIDIDNEFDFIFAESLMKQRIESRNHVK